MTPIRPALRARPEVVLFLHLALLSIYSVTLLAEKVMHFEKRVDVPLIALNVALWAAIAAIYLRNVRNATDRRRYLASNLGYPILLFAPALVLADNPWLVAAPLVVGYVLQLRGLAAGHAATFTLGLVTFMVLLATAGIVYAEQNEPTSRLRSWPDALTWTIVSITHMRGYDAGSPKSPDGIALSFVVSICGLLVASLFASLVIRWVIGDHKDQ